jgi:segregation and condensation protein B
MSEKKNQKALSREELLKLAREEWAADEGTPSPGAVMISDPFQIRTHEILEDQESSDELDLDRDLDDTEGAVQISEEQIAETDRKLERLSQAIEQEQERQLKALETEVNEADAEFNPEEELKRQIAEDQALEAEMKARDSEQEASLALSAPADIAETQSCLEALLFLADKPLSINKLRDLLGEDFDQELLKPAIDGLKERYASVHHGIELCEIAGGLQFRTKPGRADYARKLAKVQTHKLSKGAMETLALVAYRQPILKEEVDKVRGVDSSHFIRGLMEKRLIHISGRSELPGRPMLYSTSQEFLEVFGLRSLEDLPTLREIESLVPSSEVGQNEEDPRVKEMRRLVSQMHSSSATEQLEYNPNEDEVILSEIREKVKSISTTTPYLEYQETLEKLQKDGSLPTEAMALAEVWNGDEQLLSEHRISKEVRALRKTQAVPLLDVWPEEVRLNVSVEEALELKLRDPETPHAPLASETESTERTIAPQSHESLPL